MNATVTVLTWQSHSDLVSESSGYRDLTGPGGSGSSNPAQTPGACLKTAFTTHYLLA